MTNTWHKLILTGEKHNLETVSASILPFICGLEEKNKSMDIFIEENQKNRVDKILEQNLITKSLIVEWTHQEREDWHLLWKDNFIPIEFDNGLKIVPDWYESSNSDKIIKIKPGMAFGTGHHETTHLMLTELIKSINPGMTVLDLGSGSGILAITAKKLGAGKVTAVEYDHDCAVNFRENLALNQLSGQVVLKEQDVLRWQDFSYDLILVNINKKVITKLVKNMVESKANIFITGVLTEHESEITKLLQTHHFKIIAQQNKNEWMFIHIRYNE